MAALTIWSYSKFMTEILRSETEFTPEIAFDFKSNVFLIKGNSYPENVSDFYGGIIPKLSEHLATVQDVDLHFTFNFVYFSSTTAKIIMQLFDELDECAQNGNTVSIEWNFESEDEEMQKIGEEFGEDLETAKFATKERYS